MARDKKLEAPVTLFASIESKQHEILRTIAFNQRRSIADLVREAIDDLIQKQPESVRADLHNHLLVLQETAEEETQEVCD